MNQAVTVLVGSQWGDEGKGKWIDILAKDMDVVARYQGGNNAGHTLIVNDKKIVLHHLPSGILYPDKIVAMAAGMVINPIKLYEELDNLKSTVSHNVFNAETMWISARAHVITPWHIHLDSSRENSTSVPIGTTKRGIGPTYSSKADRTGLRMGDFISENRRRTWEKQMRAELAGFATFQDENAALWEDFYKVAKKLAPFVNDAEAKLRKMIHAGKSVLIEGAQATLLDLDHGTYPFVTSSGTTAGGACQSIGLPARSIDRVIGVAKAYITRVGTGPFPTELKDKIGSTIAERGHEFGSTTGRPRRCGWLDLVALKYAHDVNGFSCLAINKIDILSGLEEVKLCTAYNYNGKEISELPYDNDILDQCEPVYKSFPGWQIDNTCKSWDDLPKSAKDYLKFIEDYCGTKVGYLGTGPQRNEWVAPS